MKITVVHVSGSRAGAREELEGEVITVGREPANLLRFDPVADDKVSSFHAKLEVRGEALLLTDLGSRNGTLLNGHRITAPIEVRPGAVVTFGDKGPSVVFQFGAAAPGAVAPRPTAAAATVPAAAKATAPAPAPVGAVPAGPAKAATAAKPAGGGPKLLRWGCLGSVGAFLLAVVISLVLLGVSSKARSMVPGSVQVYLRRIPGVGKLFTAPATPTLPGGVRVPTSVPKPPGGGQKPPPQPESPPPDDGKKTEPAPAPGGG